MSNKEIGKNNSGEEVKTDWDILSSELQDEIAEAVEDSNLEAEDNAAKAEEDTIGKDAENQDIAKAHSADYYKEHEDELSNMLEDLIRLRGGSKSVKRGEWNNELRTHLDENGMPTDYAHLMRFVKDNPDKIETLVQEYDNRLKHEAEELSGQNEEYDAYMEKFANPFEGTAAEIAKETPRGANESWDDYEARINRYAKMQEAAEKLPRLSTDEGLEEAAQGKRVQFLSQFDLEKPIWGQMNDDQKAELRQRYPRKEDEKLEDWRAKVEAQLGVKVWANSEKQSAAEAPKPHQPEGPKPQSSQETQPATPKAGEKPAEKAAEAKQERAQAATAEGRKNDDDWYSMNRWERRVAAEKARAEAIDKLNKKDTEKAPEDNNAEAEARKQRTAEKAAKLTEAANFYNGLEEKDKILFMTGNAELLNSESENVAEDYFKPLLESGAIKVEKRASLEDLCKQYPQYAEYFKASFEDAEQEKPAEKGAEKGEKSKAELSERAKDYQEKLKEIRDSRQSIMEGQAKLFALHEELHSLPKRSIFRPELRRRRLEIQAEIDKLSDSLKESEQKQKELEESFRTSYQEALLSEDDMAALEAFEKSYIDQKQADVKKRILSKQHEIGDLEGKINIADNNKEIDELKAKKKEAELEMSALGRLEQQEHSATFDPILPTKEQVAKAEAAMTKEQLTDRYMRAVSETKAFTNETKTEAEKLSGDERDAYLKSRRAGTESAATFMAESGRKLCLALGDQCTSAELGNEWRAKINSAKKEAMYYVYCSVAEMIPAAKAGNSATAKRTFDSMRGPSINKEHAISVLKQYFGVSDDFIAQLRGTDGEKQQAAA